MAGADRAGRSSPRARDTVATFGRSFTMKKILVAYDGGEPAHRALEAGIEMVKAFGGELTVVSVVPLHPGRVAIDPWDDRAVHDQQLAEARDLLAGQGVVAQLIEPVGEPAHAIEQVATDGQFDVIIIGSRGLGSVSRLLQGSVSDHVATHAKTTVVIAR
jgi:nucleotide-binding universal stress UspA family protein